MATARSSSNTRGRPGAAARRPAHGQVSAPPRPVRQLWTQTPSDNTPRTTSQPRPCRAKHHWLDRNGGGLSPLRAAPLGYDKPLCASLDGFSLHAATRAGALDPQGREKLLCYVLRPPIANKRIERRPDGLVRIALKRAFADGTLAVEMDAEFHETSS